MTDLRTALRSSPVRALGIGILVGLVVLVVRQVGVLEPLELTAYDWIVRMTTPSDNKDPRIVLITITEEDLQQLEQWPVSDENIAKALNMLTKAGARAIGLDLYRDQVVQPGREELNAVLAKHPEIVVVMKFPDEQGKGVPAPEILRGTDQVGFNDILVDPGGVVRRGFLFLENQNETVISFSLLLALRYLDKEGIVPQPDASYPELMRIGKTTIPRFRAFDGGYAGSDDNGYQMLIKFMQIRDTFERFSLTRLLSGAIPPTSIKDKVVIIGTEAKSVRDDFYTPLSLGQDHDQQIPGVELHAHLVSQFLRMALNQEFSIRSMTEIMESTWILVWGILGALVTLILVAPWALIFLLGGGIVVLLLTVQWAMDMNWWVPLLPPALAWIGAGSIMMAWIANRNRSERRLLMQIFSQHVSAEIAEIIWNKREEFLENGSIRSQKLMATVLFADLEGFTTIAEQLPPESLMKWLNGNLTSMARIISAYGGVVDDYYGDGVKANFGIPFPRNEHDDIRKDATNAVQCGLAMIQEMSQLNKRDAQHALPIRKVRIGIATGLVIAGNVGGDQRVKYTTVGDIVNIAARLEQLGKDQSVDHGEEDTGSLLITEETKAYLDETRWTIQTMGEIDLHGKQLPVKIYQVLRGP